MKKESEIYPSLGDFESAWKAQQRALSDCDCEMTPIEYEELDDINDGCREYVEEEGEHIPQYEPRRTVIRDCSGLKEGW